jgi:myo-inositol-1-phosphate synthase
MDLELRLSVEDSPNSAGVAIDMIRCAKLALQRELGGVLEGPSAYFCKHPPRQFPDDKACQMTENFITQYPEKVREMSDYRRRQNETARADKKP